MICSYCLLFFGRPCVKRFAICYRTVVLSVSVLSCLSVTLVYCGQTVGRIKMKLGMQVGLGRGHIVLDGDPALSPKRGGAPQFSAHVYCGQTAGLIKMALGMEIGLGQTTLCYMGIQLPSPKKGQSHVCCGQTAGCNKMPLDMEVGLSPGDFVLDGDPAPSAKRGGAPTFSLRLLWPNGCMDQDATWYGGRPRPTRHCVRWGPSSPLL